MLGGGNPVGGSNPTGIGQTLNYIGDFAYAYSGKVSVDNNETALLKFTTQNTMVKCRVQFNINDASGGERFEHNVKIDNQIVQGYQSPGGTDTTGRPDVPLYIIIPPFTKFEATAKNVQDTASRNVMVAVTGRVYQ
tara:strand:+ start:410 stop:817 length:408 start_codon:yes stop_codon:yes gene_type:complete